MDRRSSCSLEVLDGCCGGCPPELGELLEDLQLASPRSTLDATSFLDAIFPGANVTDVRCSAFQFVADDVCQAMISKAMSGCQAM